MSINTKTGRVRIASSRFIIRGLLNEKRQVRRQRYRSVADLQKEQRPTRQPRSHNIGIDIINSPAYSQS